MISSNSKKYINKKKLLLLEKYDKLFDEYAKSCKKISKHKSIYFDVYKKHMKKLLSLLHFIHQIYRITFKKNMPQINMFDMQTIKKHNIETEKYIYIDAFGTPIERRSNTSVINTEYILPIANNNYGEEETKYIVRFSDSKTLSLSKRYSLDDKQSGGKYTKYNEKLLYSTIIHRCIRLSFIGGKILFNNEPEKKYSEDALDDLEYIKYMSILPYYISLKERSEDIIPLFTNIDIIDKKQMKYIYDIETVEDIFRKINILHNSYLPEEYTISYNNKNYEKHFNDIKGYSDDNTLRTILYTIINNNYNNVINKDYYYWFPYNSPLPAITILDTETFIYGIHTFQPLKLTETRISDIIENYIGKYPYSIIVNSSLQNYIANGIVMEKRAYKRVRNLLKYYNDAEYNMQNNKKTIYVFHGTYRDFSSNYNKDVVLTSFLSCTFDISVAIKYAYENVKNSGVVYILELNNNINYINFNDEYYQIILAPGLKITVTNVLVVGSIKYNFCKVSNTDKEYVEVLYSNIFEGGNGKLKLYNIKNYKIYKDKDKYPLTSNILLNSIEDLKYTYICLGNQVNNDVEYNTYFNIKYTLHQHFICDCYNFFKFIDYHDKFLKINVVNYGIYYDSNKLYTGYKKDDNYEDINIGSNDYKRFQYNFENLFIDSLLHNEDALYPLNYMKNKKIRGDYNYKLNSFRGAGLFDTDGFKKINFNIHEPSKVYMELIKEYISRNEDRNSLFIKDITRDYMKIIIEKTINYLIKFRDEFIDMLRDNYINFIDINMMIYNTTEEHKDLIEMFNDLVDSLKITINYYIENMENGNIYNEIEPKIYERKIGGKMNITTRKSINIAKYSKLSKINITNNVIKESYKSSEYTNNIAYDNKGYAISYDDYVKFINKIKANKKYV
jgi:hypothetical protein